MACLHVCLQPISTCFSLLISTRTHRYISLIAWCREVFPCSLNLLHNSLVHTFPALTVQPISSYHLWAPRPRFHLITPVDCHLHDNSSLMGTSRVTFIFWMPVWVCQIFVLPNLCAFVFSVPYLYLKIEFSDCLEKSCQETVDNASFIIRCLTWSMWTLRSIGDMFLSDLLNLYRSPKTTVGFLHGSTVIADFQPDADVTAIVSSLYLSDDLWWLSPPFYSRVGLSFPLGIEMQGKWHCWAQHLQRCWWFLNSS